VTPPTRLPTALGITPETLLPTPSTAPPTPFPAPETVLPTPPVEQRVQVSFWCLRHNLGLCPWVTYRWILMRRLSSLLCLEMLWYPRQFWRLLRWCSTKSCLRWLEDEGFKSVWCLRHHFGLYPSLTGSVTDGFAAWTTDGVAYRSLVSSTSIMIPRNVTRTYILASTADKFIGAFPSIVGSFADTATYTTDRSSCSFRYAAEGAFDVALGGRIPSVRTSLCQISNGA
jgi:hypothetical protein